MIVIMAMAFRLAVALALAVAGSVAAAHPPPQSSTPDKRPITLPALIALVPIPLAPSDTTADAAALCEDRPGGLAWLDRMHTRLYKTVCLAAAKFDGFFGNARFDDEYQATHGSLALGGLWDQRDGFAPSVRFRADIRLPQLSDRMHVFVGRLDPAEYVTEQRDDFDTLPRLFGRPSDDTLLLGIGYSQPARPGGRFDFGVGAALGWPLDPYVKTTYRLSVPFHKRNALRLSEAIFWQDSFRLGDTLRIDLERLLGENLLARWTGSGTFAQTTEGVRWFSSVTLYQNLKRRRAIGYQLGISGETNHEVPIADYGLRVIYRRSVLREWLFLELRSSITWPRATLLERRESNLGAGLAFEVTFGERKK